MTEIPPQSDPNHSQDPGRQPDRRTIASRIGKVLRAVSTFKGLDAGAAPTPWSPERDFSKILQADRDIASASLYARFLTC